MPNGYVQYYEDEETEYIDSNGEIHRTKSSTVKSKKIQYGKEEEGYFRTYDQYEAYLDDMPRSHYNAMKKILHYIAEPANREMRVHLDVGTKKRLMEMLGIQDLQSLNNIVSKLTKGNCLIRMGVGLYRINPWFWGRGKWSDIQSLRDISPHPFEFTTYGTVIAGNHIKRVPIILNKE